MNDDNHWFILGAGSIGCLWAAQWCKQNTPVTLIQKDKPTGDQLTLINGSKKESFLVNQTTIKQLLADNHVINQLLVTTKAQHILSALQNIESLLNENSSIIILQNGMASVAVKEQYPQWNIITGITNDGAYRSNKKTVVYAGHGETFIAADQPLLSLLPTALQIMPCDNIVTRQWQKLAINCAINGLTAIYQCRNGELLEKPEAMQRINQLCAEIITIAEIEGYKNTIDLLKEQVINTLKTTANNYSSMYQDIQKGNSTEIDYLNGYLIKIADINNIDCTHNQQVLAEIKQLEQSSKKNKE